MAKEHSWRPLEACEGQHGFDVLDELFNRESIGAQRRLPRSFKIEADDGERGRQVLRYREEIGRPAEPVERDEGWAGARNLDEQ